MKYLLLIVRTDCRLQTPYSGYRDVGYRGRIIVKDFKYSQSTHQHESVDAKC